MTGLTVQPAGRGLPGIPRARRVAPPEAKYLDERNDERGRKAMDKWCWERNELACVCYIAVEPTSRRAGYSGGK